jgi:hypothetical protein
VCAGIFFVPERNLYYFPSELRLSLLKEKVSAPAKEQVGLHLSLP